MNDIKLALLGSPGAGKSGEDATAAASFWLFQ